MTQLSIVRQVDITTVPVDAIVCLRSTEMQWNGQIDLAIQQVAGDQYHVQAMWDLFEQAQIGTIDPAPSFARGSKSQHHGNFDHVIFTWDLLIHPLNKLVFAALRVAYNNNLNSIALPTMRTGTAQLNRQTPEKTMDELAQQMALGIARFVREYPIAPLNIHLVIYNLPQYFALFGKWWSHYETHRFKNQPF
jgi:O-acetyl-ADP-ribose deacetylase (regulator of RNase III)